MIKEIENKILYLLWVDLIIFFVVIRNFFTVFESILNREDALHFKIAQIANKSALSTLSASESSNTLSPS